MGAQGGEALRRKRQLRKRDILLILAAALAVLVGIYLAAQWLEDQSAKPEPRGNYEQRYEDEQITLNGEKYRRRQGITTILLMGIDKEETDGPVPAYLKYMNGGQADFLRLLVIDSNEKTITQVEIDRDTMTPITVLGMLGSKVGVRTSQICLSHGFGDGKEQSCEFTVDAVSNLLGSIYIKYYVAMDLDGISDLNDALGGITVTLEDDFSHIDPAMRQGSTLTLTGNQAEIFVRSRMSMSVGTNEARMKRQQQYIARMSDQLNARIHADENFIGSLFDTLSPHMVTSLSRAQMITEAWTSRDFDRKPLVQIAGSYAVGSDGYKEFHADEKAIESIVLDLFYQKMK